MSETVFAITETKV